MGDFLRLATKWVRFDGVKLYCMHPAPVFCILLILNAIRKLQFMNQSYYYG